MLTSEARKGNPPSEGSGKLGTLRTHAVGVPNALRIGDALPLRYLDDPQAASINARVMAVSVTDAHQATTFTPRRWLASICSGRRYAPTVAEKAHQWAEPAVSRQS